MRTRFVALIVTVAFLTGAGAAAAQNISGIVLGSGAGAPPVRGALVTMFDALNADLLATAVTDFDGLYDSGIIPAGDYRLRFDGEFHAGKEGSFSFCSADVLAVLPLSTTIVDHRFSGPAFEIPDSGKDQGSKGALTGTVRDAATLAPLQGIQVNLLDSDAAVLLATTVTGADGMYEFSGSIDNTARARFLDPSGLFFPQFFSMAGTDAFCDATPVSFGDEPPLADVFMNRIPPEYLTQQLVDTIDSFDLPASVNAMLGTPVIRLLDLLTDNNTNNNMAACGQLTAFVSRVNVQEKKGQLSPAEADALRQSADNVAAFLGCQ